jgi:starch synthase (maltosyl-transferring)
MRPNLFANTPDILHEFLQHGGPPAFRIRLVLAATLGASYGIYSGFELFENVPVRPGSEEYLDSEKYQIRVRDWNTPNTLEPLITRINQIRRAHASLHSDRGLRFFPTDNDQVICYAKATEDRRDMLLMVVSLDPRNMQHGFVRVPAFELETDAAGAYVVEDLLTGSQFSWRGEWNYVRLGPELPAHVFRLPSRPAAPGA